MSLLIPSDIFYDLSFVGIAEYMLNFQAGLSFLLKYLSLLGVAGCEVCDRPRCPREPSSFAWTVTPTWLRVSSNQLMDGSAMPGEACLCYPKQEPLLKH